MLIEDAIERLKDMRRDCDYYDDLLGAEALDIANDAIEKQIPKKPIETEFDYECPVCGWEYMTDELYCPRCGQKFDWSE